MTLRRRSALVITETDSGGIVRERKKQVLANVPQRGFGKIARNQENIARVFDAGSTERGRPYFAGLEPGP